MHDLSETSVALDLVEQIVGARVLVIGDVMLDRYWAGVVNRISPEAPVPVVRFDHAWSVPGGAANVVGSLAALGCQTTLAGIVGDDEAGRELAALLARAGVQALDLLTAPVGGTITKTRILGGGFHQLLRLDHEPAIQTWATLADQHASRLAALVPQHQAVVLADYDKGTLTSAVLRMVIETARTNGIPVVVDPKKSDFTVYHGATVLTPNTAEIERAIGEKISSAETLDQRGRSCRELWGLTALLVTQGADGMTGFDAAGAFHVPARVRQVADVTGAGDTVVSVLAAGLAAGVGLRETCQLAALAAGIAVSKPGTWMVTFAELGAELGGASGKILAREPAKQRIARWKSEQKRVVFTNGCFDVLHAGHLHSLENARRYGDVLVVGLNADESVRRLKGPTRPVNSEVNRARLLAGLACVDLVVLFEEDTPEELIQSLDPNVLVKGGDYDPLTIAGSDYVRSRGGEVHVVPLIAGLSTTAILRAGVSS